MVSRFRKAIGILQRPRFTQAVLLHHVAASVEHREVIGMCAANTLIDAGANKGQFSLAFRERRPTARIIAFEPLPEAADTFSRVFARDALASIHSVALAAASGSATLHVATRSDSSSLLKLGTGQARAFGVRTADTIEVPIRRLDACVDMGSLSKPILLKVDVQGGELGVFEGCDKLGDVDFIYVELSFVELYEGQPLFDDVSAYLVDRGFTVIGVFNQVLTREFGATQADVLFGRRRV